MRLCILFLVLSFLFSSLGGSSHGATGESLREQWVRVEFKNGSAVEGVIIEEGDLVIKIRARRAIGAATETYAKAEIARITKIDPPSPPEAPTNPTATPTPKPPAGRQIESPLDRLDARGRALLTKRAKWLFRMPDQSIWDGYNANEYRKVIQETLRPADQGRWRVVDGELASKWGLQWTLVQPPKRPAHSQRPGLSPWKRLEIDRDPLRIESPCPPLWVSSTAEFDGRFLLIDEASLDPLPVPKGWTGRYLNVVKSWGEGWFTVQTRGAPAQFWPAEVLVFCDQPSILSAERAVGEFFLWQDAQLSFPFNASSAQGRNRYRVIEAEKLRLTPLQAAALVEDRTIEVHEWEWKPERADPAKGDWISRPLDFKFRRPVAPVP